MQPISSIARTAISCGLGLSLALGCALAPAAIAQAEQGSLTITQLPNNDASYDAYLLFTADIDKHDQATHIAWSSPDVRTVVLDYLDQNGYGAWLSTRKLTAQHVNDLPKVFRVQRPAVSLQTFFHFGDMPSFYEPMEPI